MKERLRVSLNFGLGSAPIPIGECLWVESRKVAAFEWSARAIESAFQLSPIHLPLATGVTLGKVGVFDGLHGLFNDSIPDGFGLRLMNQSLRSLGFVRESITPLHRLAWIGAHGIGALTYAPTIGPVAARSLTEIHELAAQAAKVDAGDFADISESAIVAGGSAQGARPKFWAMVSKDGKRSILGDSALDIEGFTRCLVKFAPMRGDASEPFFEAACLQLASTHGVIAAQHRLLEHPNGTALAVTRFDRSASGERLLTQSLSALLQHDFREPTLDYFDLALVSRKLAARACDERIYRQACFNVALSIRDNHSKNFAFVMDRAGEWDLSPAYDLCPNDGPNGWHTMTVNGAGQNPTRTDLLAFAKQLGLSDAVAKEGIDAARRAASEFGPLATTLGATRSATKDWTKKFAQIDTFIQPTSIGV